MAPLAEMSVPGQERRDWLARFSGRGYRSSLCVEWSAAWKWPQSESRQSWESKGSAVRSQLRVWGHRVAEAGAPPAWNTMKPDKPTPPARDRDILRAGNTRTLKATAQPSSSSSSSVEVPSGPQATAVLTTDAAVAGTSASGEEGRGAEMRVYLDKLRELVPYVPRSGRVSRVQLIHSAIDYITDLQEALEARARRKLRDKQDRPPRPPLAALPQAHLEANTSKTTPLMENNANRLPTALETNTRHPAALTAPEAEGDTATTSRRPMSPAAPGPPPLHPS